jgi:hypothetical protein
VAVTLAVPYEVLRAAKNGWDLDADRLDGAWRRLHLASTDALSPEVAAAVEAFRETWVDEVKACADLAQQHSEAFVETDGDFRVTDVAEAERLRSLLSWTHRSAAIEEE